MYHDRDTLQQVIKQWWNRRKVAWQKAGKTLPVFFFTNEHNSRRTRSLKLLKKQRFSEEEQQLVKEKYAENIRKVLCKSFIQWFWELNLCSYKVPSRLFWFAPVILLLLLKWKSRNITKHLMSGPSGNKLGYIRTRGKTKLTVSLGIWH